MERPLYGFIILLLSNATRDYPGIKIPEPREIAPRKSTLMIEERKSTVIPETREIEAKGHTVQENLEKLAIANNDLALNLYHRIANESSDNIFFSPLSLSTVFGMLYYGTRGNTAKELRKALGYDTADLQEGLVHQAFQYYLHKSLPSHDPSAYVLHSANAILFDKHLDILPPYEREVQNLYQAIVQDVDFATRGPQIIDQINQWVRFKTSGKIDKLLDEVDPTTVLILLNAVYFKGTWKTQFNSSDTQPGTFYNNGLKSEVKKVPMMKMTEYFSQGHDSDLRASIVEIPYKGENISMLIMLPYDIDGLELLENRLTLEKLSTIRQKLDKIALELSMPKFKLQFSKEMSEDIESLGAKSIFSSGADFSGITSTQNVFVSEVLHKAVIEVNERGSEAAAATSVIMGRNKAFFTVDHPFLFAIIDTRNDMILFLGRVTNL